MTDKKRFKFRFSYLRGAGLLTLAALLGKLLGAAYRIPLTRVLGAHGMGMYHSVFPTYALLITACGGGLTAAVSKLTAENEGKPAVLAAVFTAVCFSVPAATFTALFCREIAAAAGAPQAAIALAILLPSVPVSAVCAVMRGFFQGASSMLISALGQLTEQTVKFASGLTLAYVLKNISLTAAVAGCAAGVTISEFFALGYYFICYRRNSQKLIEKAEKAHSDSSHTETAPAVDEVFSGLESLTEFSDEISPPIVSEPDNADLNKSLSPAPQACGGAVAVPRERLIDKPAVALVLKIIKVSLPVTFGLMILPLCQVADSFVIVNLLVKTGLEREYATSLYGIVTGPVLALVNLPAVFTVGLCGTLLPKVSALIKRGESVGKTAKKVLGLSAAVGLVFLAGIALFAPLGIKILYGDSLALSTHAVSRLLRLGAVSVPVIAVMQTSSAVLQGGGKAYIPALNLLVSAAVKEVLNFVLLPKIGIAGFVAATDAFYLIACVLDLIALRVFIKHTDKNAR